MRALLIRSESSRAAVRDAELADRIDYRVLDATAGLPEQYDVITTFDVAVDPLGLRAIRDALRRGGTHLCLAINCSNRTTDNVGPIASLV